MDAPERNSSTSQIIVFGFFGTFLFGFAGLVIAYAIAAQQFASNNGVNNEGENTSYRSESTVETRRELQSVRPVDRAANTGGTVSPG